MSKIITDFKKANTLTHLSTMLGVPLEILENKINEDNPELVKKPKIYSYVQKFLKELGVIEIDFNNAFYRMTIPKKNRNRKNQKRIVWGIYDKGYEEFYKRLNYILTNFITNENVGYPHVAAHGYIKGKNILENAQCHCGASLILHADISNFFNSITDSRISLMLSSFGIKENISQFLSKILTIEGVLPLGLHTSPLVSNLICLQLDEDFSNLSIKYNCKYTRYADDITISGKQLPSRQEVEAILSKHHFELSLDKFRITKPGWKHFVTGLSVETETPRIPKYKKRKLRQELYYIKKHGIKGHLDKAFGRKCSKEEVAQGINRIDGTVSYISYFERKFSYDFEKIWFDIRSKHNLYPMYENKHRGCIYLFSDETEIFYDGSNYLAVGVSSIMDTDIERLSMAFRELLDKYIMNPYDSIKKEALEKNGLHYSDASEDLKKDYLDIISKEHLYTYIAYKKLESNDCYEDIYIELLHNLMMDRLLSTEYEISDIIIEKNQDKVSTKKIAAMFAQKTRYKKVPKFEDKRCIPLSSVDFALGYFRNYVLATPKEERKRFLFESIRGQYKVIKNLDDGKVFTRRRPFDGKL